MSSCITGGGRAYRLDLDIIKSPSNSWISNSSSPSSTLSESSNFSTRKPRTPRKRPNQTYNEAAAILSTAHPKLFPTKHLINKFTKPYDHTTKNPLLFDTTSDLLMPYQVIDTSEYLLHLPIVKTQNSPVQLKELSSFEKQCQSPGETEITSQGNYVKIPPDDYRDDFDAESILDEEIGEGIDSIMGNLDVENENENESTIDDSVTFITNSQTNTCSYGYPVDLGFEFGNGLRSEIRAIRNVDEGDDWWRFPSVNVATDVNPKSAKIQAEKNKKKKKKKVEIRVLESANKEDLADKLPCEESVPQPIAKLLLKLNYDDVLKAWSDKDLPFSGDAPGTESGENDVQARLAQIDLFSENGGVREASVLRYKEKRRTRLFSKKIRYQVRKVNADRRPRMKGRFVRTPNSPDNEQS